LSKLGEGEVRERGGSCSLVLSHCSSLSLLSPFFSTSLNAVGGEVRKQPLSIYVYLFSLFFSFPSLLLLGLSFLCVRECQNELPAIHYKYSDRKNECQNASQAISFLKFSILKISEKH